MATSTIKDSRMVLTFDGGVDLDGNPVLKRKYYNGINTQATTDQLYAVANALQPLQQYPLVSVERDDVFDILA